MARPEFEGKVLGVEPRQTAARIIACGGTAYGERLQRRYVYDLGPGQWLRLRDAGSEVTLCLKTFTHDGVGGTSETETTVGDFATAHELLVAAGHTRFGYQENRRDSFTLDGASLELDTWPGIPPYLEIEGESEDHVYAVAARLGFTPGQLTGISTVHVYAAYGLELDPAIGLSFAAPPRDDPGAWTGSVTVSKARALAVTPRGKLLLLRCLRDGQDEPFWVLPGGGIDPGDTSVEAAVCREVAEESGGTFHIGRLAHIAWTPNNNAHHAIFTGHVTGMDPALRHGPEVDTPDGVYDLHEVDLDPAVLEPMDIWPPAAKTWLMIQLYAGRDLAALPDLREQAQISWAPYVAGVTPPGLLKDRAVAA